MSSLLQTCFGCLCVDRKLEALGNLTDLFCTFLNNKYLKKDLHNALICWECKAILENIKNFIIQVNSAQNYLLTNTTPHNPPPCLSKLNKSRILQWATTCDDTQNVNIQDDNIIYPNIKEEQLESDDDTKVDIELDLHPVDNNEWPDYESLKPVKLKKEKAKNYLLLDHKPKDVGSYKKVKISTEDMHTYLEVDRCDKEFLSKKFRCFSCVWSVATEKQFKKHNLKYHEIKTPHQCDVCLKYFPKKMALATHNKQHYFLRKCNQCSYETVVKKNIVIHISKYHEEKNVKCLKCYHCFRNTRIFYEHYQELHKKFVCDECGKICKKKRVLESHIENNHSDYTCKLCNIKFKSRSILRGHNQHKHPVDNNAELSYCVECDKQCESIVAFKRHLVNSKAHSNNRKKIEKRISCPECEKTYVRRCYMMNHYRHVHMKQSKFHCQDCDKYFLNRTRFVDHRKYSHEGLKPVKNKLCTVCGRGFSTNRILEKHMRTHTGERPFECTYCDSKFTQKESLQNHIRHIHHKIKRHNPTWSCS